MYTIRKAQTVKTFKVVDIFNNKQYVITWNNYTSNPWVVEDEQGEFIDNEVAICRNLIAMIQDEFDEWTE
jgi:hypothetical protein